MVLGMEADPELPSISGGALLVEAILKKDFSGARTLLDHDAKVDNKCPTSGKTAFHASVEHGDLAFFGDVLGIAGDLNLKDSDGVTALQMTVASGDVVRAGMLLDKGAARPDASLMKETLKRRDVAMMELFLESGVDPNIQDGDAEKRIFDLAVESGATQAVRLLLEKGAYAGTIFGRVS